MKVLNLRCGHEHSFEGWFGSDADYESQLDRKLIECPMCGNGDIMRMPTAPRLNVSHLREGTAGRSERRGSQDEHVDKRSADHEAQREAGHHDAQQGAGRQPSRPAPTPGATAQSGALTVPPAREMFDPRSPEHAQALAQAQAEAMHALREVIEKTEDVGDQFSEEARRMHYGEAEQRNIRGVATADDAMALRDEGIDVVALPMPPSLKGRLQ